MTPGGPSGMTPGGPSGMTPGGPGFDMSYGGTPGGPNDATPGGPPTFGPRGAIPGGDEIMGKNGQILDYIGSFENEKEGSDDSDEDDFGRGTEINASAIKNSYR